MKCTGTNLPLPLTFEFIFDIISSSSSSSSSSNRIVVVVVLLFALKTELFSSVIYIAVLSVINIIIF
jgi:hypothetical protein